MESPPPEDTLFIPLRSTANNRAQAIIRKSIATQGMPKTSTAAPATLGYTNPTAYFKADESIFSNSMSDLELNDMLEGISDQPVYVQPIKKKQDDSKNSNKLGKLLPTLLLGLVSKDKLLKNQQMHDEREREMRKRISRLFG